jgi:hypothetical protein
VLVLVLYMACALCCDVVLNQPMIANSINCCHGCGYDFYVVIIGTIEINPPRGLFPLLWE